MTVSDHDPRRTSLEQLGQSRQRHIIRASRLMMLAAAVASGCSLPPGGDGGSPFTSADGGFTSTSADGGGGDAGASDAGQNSLSDAGACHDDSREENDNPTSGTAASAAYHIFGGSMTFSGQVACPGDDDYIRGYADCCPGFGVTVQWDPSDGDLVVDLLNAAGTPISLNGPADVHVRQPGYVELLETDQGSSEFLVRIRSQKRVPYEAVLQAPMYAP